MEKHDPIIPGEEPGGVTQKPGKPDPGCPAISRNPTETIRRDRSGSGEVTKWTERLESFFFFISGFPIRFEGLFKGILSFD